MLTSTPNQQTVPLAPPAEGGLSAGVNGIYTMWRRDLLRFVRDRSRIISSFGQPILFLFVFGSGLSPLMGQTTRGANGFNYVQFMFPGIIVMAVLFTAISSAISVVWDREFGFLKEVLVAPVPRWAVVVGKALGGSTTAMLQGTLMLIFAPLVGVRLTILSVLELLPTMLLTAFALSTFGLVVAARLKTMEGFQMIMNFLLMPMFFLSGALFPLTNLPSWLEVLTHLNPVSYGVDAIRQIVLAQSVTSAASNSQVALTLFGHPTGILIDLALIAVFAFLTSAVAVRAFNVTD